MFEQSRVQLTCPNGHLSSNPKARFCFSCGAQLAPFVNQQIPPQQVVPIPHQQNPIQRQNLSPAQTALQPPVTPVPVRYVPVCPACGGEGQRLSPASLVCNDCAWLRPLFPGYVLDQKAFQWSEDGKAMAALRAIRPLNAVARAISDKVGRQWIESTFNGVLLGENQLPEVYGQAVKAARLLGMTHMPDVYVSGERTWDCMTYGSDKDAFILIGTALATNFRGPELMFLFAREMGHCRAGHALWKTVIRFLVGEQGPRKGLMGGGLLSALSPSALLEGALEMPLLAWARQAEITADRAGLLAIGDEDVARRVLLSWTLKSSFLFNQINIEAWLEQQGSGDDGISKLSELTTSSTPYITRRLSFLQKFAKSHELKFWETVLGEHRGSSRPALLGAGSMPAHAAGPVVQSRNSSPDSADIRETINRADQVMPASDQDIRTKCSACGASMRIPSAVLEGKVQLNVRCPNSTCKKVVTLKRKVGGDAPQPATPAKAPLISETEGNLSDVNE